MSKKPIREWLADEYPFALVMEERYDHCIIAAGVSFDGNQYVVYDFLKVCEELMKDGMSQEEAYEYYAYNMQGAWIPPCPPAYVELIPAEED